MAIPNQELRDYAKAKGVPLHEAAKNLGVCEMTLLRWLRYPLPDEKKTAFIKAVDEISAENVKEALCKISAKKGGD